MGARSGRLASLAALAAVALVGCGGGDEEQSPEQQAPAAVETFFNGIADEDFETACGALASDLLAALGGGNCSAGLSAVAQGIEPNYEILDVRVSGTKAAVDVELTNEAGETREDTVELVQENSEWLISSFGE